MATRKSNKIDRVCEACGKKFLAFPSRLKAGPCRFCSRNCSNSKSIKDRFISFVGPEQENGCRIWKGGKNPGKFGYGKFHYKNGITDYAHRVSYELFNDVVIPKGIKVLHSCDNPICINHKHLFLGTSKDNSSDMVKKGRSSKGEKNGFSKLNEEKVKEIFILYTKNKFTQLHIAKKFNVSQGTIHLIISGKRWIHVTSNLLDILP